MATIEPATDKPSATAKEPIHRWTKKDSEDLERCMREVAEEYPNTMRLLADA